jgi:hypothetical protein
MRHRTPPPISLNLDQRVEFPSPESKAFLSVGARDLIRDGSLLHACVGLDYQATIETFHSLCADLWLVDLHTFKKTALLPLLLGQPRYELIEQQFTGRFMVASARLREPLVDGRAPPPFSASRCTEIYRDREVPGRLLRLHRLSQCAADFLQTECKPESLTAIMHNGDSSGEGGSGLRFFSMAPEHEGDRPTLLGDVYRTLKPTGLIISDGSNCDLPHLIKVRRAKCSSYEAWRDLEGRDLICGAHRWSCVGWLPPRYGPTLIWKVTAA